MWRNRNLAIQIDPINYCKFKYRFDTKKSCAPVISCSAIQKMAFVSTFLPTFSTRTSTTSHHSSRCNKSSSYARSVPRLSLSSTDTNTSKTPAKTEENDTTTALPLIIFHDYFAAMSGAWNSDRTYHYVPERRREKSQTTFNVSRLTSSQIDAVLESNGETTATLAPKDVVFTEGFRVTFLTRMESKGGLVESGTNLAFVPRNVNESKNLVTGDYFRDLGYEEKGPKAAKFTFDAHRMQLTMTTVYTKVVSVDQIRLINPNVRLREIVNYRRPASPDAPLVDPLLVGFGVELKGEPKPLVEQLA